MQKIDPKQIEYHRNGISGEGFYVIKFNDPEHGAMLGVVFPTPGHVAVFNEAKLGDGDINFGSNSWRGDVYEPALRVLADFS